MGQPLIIRDERDDGKQYWDSGTRWLIISLVSALISFVGLLGYEIVQVHAANSGAGQSTMVTYSDFVNQVNANNVASVTIQTGTVAGAFKTPIDYPANSTTKVWQFQTYEPDGADVSLVPLLQQHDVMVVSKPASQDNFWASVLLNLLPIGIFIVPAAMSITFIILLVNRKPRQQLQT